MRLLLFLYDIVLVMVTLILVPIYVIKGFLAGRVRSDIPERFGLYAPEKWVVDKDRFLIWIHAASIGETKAVESLIPELRKQYPDCFLLLSTFSVTAQEMSRQMGCFDRTIYLPIDISWLVKRAFDIFRPQLLVIVETEIWPNLIKAAGDADIPLILVNGRISDRSLSRYLKLKKVLRNLFENFSVICVQTELDRDRWHQIGARNDQIVVTGNMKFDGVLANANSQNDDNLKAKFGLTTDKTIWVAGSTHSPEEQCTIDVFLNLRKRFSLQLVLAPRHPKRVPEIVRMIENAGLSYQLRSMQRCGVFIEDVLLIDTIGELADLYSAADVVFVGGSLAQIGGHNLLEAVVWKKPLIFGSHIHSQRESASALLSQNGAICLSSAEDLENSMATLLADKPAAVAMGERAFEAISSHAGATANTVRAIADVCKG